GRARPGAPAGSESDVRRRGDLDAYRRVPGDRELTPEIDRCGELARCRLERGRSRVPHQRRSHERRQSTNDRHDDQQFGQCEPASGHPPNPPIHQTNTRSPQNRAIAPPAARNGPNGSGSWRPRRPVARSTAPRAPPRTIATNSATSSAFQPRKAPSIAPNLRSPPPIPPRLTRMITRKRPPPRRMPRTESSHEMRRLARLITNPTRKPGRVIASGIIW